MRLPAAALTPLLSSCVCAACSAARGGGNNELVLRIKVPAGAQQKRDEPVAVGGDVFEIEGVVGAKKASGAAWRYLVRWKGYPPEDDTYVSRCDLVVQACTFPVPSLYLP